MSWTEIRKTQWTDLRLPERESQASRKEDHIPENHWACKPRPYGLSPAFPKEAGVAQPPKTRRTPFSSDQFSSTQFSCIEVLLCCTGETRSPLLSTIFKYLVRSFSTVLFLPQGKCRVFISLARREVEPSVVHKVAPKHLIIEQIYNRKRHDLYETNTVVFASFIACFISVFYFLERPWPSKMRKTQRLVSPLFRRFFTSWFNNLPGHGFRKWYQSVRESMSYVLSNWFLEYTQGVFRLERVITFMRPVEKDQPW